MFSWKRKVASESLRLGHQLVLDLALIGVLRVRRVANTGIDPGVVVHDAAGIDERLETPPAVVFAIPELPTSPNGSSGISG
jgi:hypothetical protein